ncbi:hypothetical protein B0T21DRAFT_453651 [Apiosordaria backusii]|uniref:Uncharacterized protein n=1 Tax=Apiosordaria backusii TaxID=314023 RepID=A0AA40ASM3_9PEZI|nr:hypothetical protein B0T21DRAFT_453651 [Apiosordaria backusii]
MGVGLARSTSEIILANLNGPYLHDPRVVSLDGTLSMPGTTLLLIFAMLGKLRLRASLDRPLRGNCAFQILNESISQRAGDR